jgi:hypothetical protein
LLSADTPARVCGSCETTGLTGVNERRARAAVFRGAALFVLAAVPTVVVFARAAAFLVTFLAAFLVALTRALGDALRLVLRAVLVATFLATFLITRLATLFADFLDFDADFLFVFGRFTFSSFSAMVSCLRVPLVTLLPSCRQEGVEIAHDGPFEASGVFFVMHCSMVL